MKAQNNGKPATDRTGSPNRATALRRASLVLLTAAGLLAAGAAQANLSISNIPLYLSTGVKPNVMIELDTSGSMNNLVWAKGYDPDHTYPSLYIKTQYCSGYIKYYNYSDGYYHNITLPSPEGCSTRYDDNYIRYLVDTYGNGADLTNGQIPTESRIEAAKNVSKNVVDNNPKLRFGLTTFNRSGYHSANGGSIVSPIQDNNQSAIDNEIDNSHAASNTPVAETLYEITRYFRGLSAYQGEENAPYKSPIQYRCQKNFVISVTDGLPTYDKTFPDDDKDDPNGKLPDWDGNNDNYYLADIAKFAHDIDMRPDLPKTQNLSTYTVGFSIDNDELELAADKDHGDGQYFTAQDTKQLNAKLQQVISSIKKRTSSASNVASSSGQVKTDTKVFQGRFTSGEWSGQLRAYEISGPKSNSLAKAWDASDQLPPKKTNASQRKIYVYKAGATNNKLEFTRGNWDKLTATQQNELNTNESGNNDGLGKDRIGYLRGKNDNEAPQGDKFRVRPTTVLGDIVHSSPAYAGAPPALRLGNNYLTTFRNNKSGRTALVYAGANDGMLHAFKADDAGKEAFAYIPKAVFSKLSDLTSPGYNTRHEYFVDGQQTIHPAYYGGNWHSVLVGTLGAGGKGVYALQVDDGNLGKVLWDYSATDYQKLGNAISQTSVVRIGGTWYALFGNGYNSANGHAVFFFVNIGTGKVTTIDTGVGNDNGLATPVAVDIDNDQTTDYIYAGDLKGNMWKIDVRNGLSPEPSATKFFVAKGPGGDTQPITAKPEAGLNPQGGIYVYFGTGQYFASGDAIVPKSPPKQTFYGIQDKFASSGNYTIPTRKQNLAQQQVITTKLKKTSKDKGKEAIATDQLEVTSDNELQKSDRGWYLDLAGKGERAVTQPALRAKNRVIFTTKTPDKSPCNNGGTSKLYELNALSGSRLDYTPFDVNGDDDFNDKDFLTLDNGDKAFGNVYKLQGLGLASAPAILGKDDGTELIIASGSGQSGGGKPGDDDNTEEIHGNSGTQPRLSWHQIQ